MQVIILLDYSMIFPEEDMYDYDYYIEGIEKEKLTYWVSHLIPNSDLTSLPFDLDLNFFLDWFGPENKDYASMIYEKIENVKTNEKERDISSTHKYTLFNPLSILTLIEFLISRKTVSSLNQKDIFNINVNLFKLLLRINKDFNDKIKLKLNDDISFDLNYFISLTLSNRELLNSSRAYLLYSFATQLIKSSYLFDFLKEKNSSLLGLFLAKYGCKLPDQYYYLWLAVVDTVFYENNNENIKDVKQKTFVIDENNESIVKFINEFIINKDSSSYAYEENTDFQYIRSSPIIEINNGTYYIINDLLLIQKTYNGLYFELKKLYDGRKEDFRSYYTYNFTEKWLLYKILNDIYGRRGYKQFSGDDIESLGFKGGPDYYIRNGKNIFIFENKDIFINGEAKMSHDISLIKQAIDEKLVTKKGIPQLIKNVKYALNKEYSFDKGYKSNSCKIYPIIITHRAEFDAYGLNKYLNIEFQKQLKQIDKDYNINNVKNLTIINIDILLLNKFILKNKKANLNEMIDSYFKFVDVSKIRLKTVSEIDERIDSTYISFNDFILKEWDYSKGKIDFFQEVSKLVNPYLANIFQYKSAF